MNAQPTATTTTTIPRVRDWDRFYSAALRPKRLSSSLQTPSTELKNGIRNLMLARSDFVRPHVPGVKNALPVFFQVEGYNTFLCQCMFHFIGASCKSEAPYIRRVLRPETRTQFTLLNAGRRAGKSLQMSQCQATLLHRAQPNTHCRHYAGTYDQAKIVIIYTQAILKNRNLGSRLEFTSNSIRMKHPMGDSTAIAASLTENERGKMASHVSLDEYPEANPTTVKNVVMGMTINEETTLGLFSTRKDNAMGGVERVAESYNNSLEPGMKGQMLMGVCTVCQDRLKTEEMEAHCWHVKYAEGTWNSQTQKAKIIKEIILSLGGDPETFMREGLNVTSTSKNYVIVNRDLITRCFSPNHKLPQQGYTRINVGIDSNGGSAVRDKLGIMAFGRLEDGRVEICGIGCFTIGSLSLQVAQTVHSFIEGLTQKFPHTPILIEMEAQPTGWAQAVFLYLARFRGVYFVCDKENAANGGFGIPMGNGNKNYMAGSLDTYMRGGLKMAPEPFLLSNVTNFQIRNQITPTNRDDYLLLKTRVEFQALQYIKDPKTGTTTVGGKMEGTDDIACGGLHGIHSDFLIGEINKGYALRCCWRPTDNHPILNLPQYGPDWNYIMREMSSRPPLDH